MKRFHLFLAAAVMASCFAGCGMARVQVREQTRAAIRDAVSAAGDIRGEVQKEVNAALDGAFEGMPDWRAQIRDEVRESLVESGFSFEGSDRFPEDAFIPNSMIGEIVAEETSEAFREAFRDGWSLDGEGKGEQVKIQDADGNVLGTLTDRAEISELFETFQLDESQLSVLPQNARVQYVCVVFQQRTRLAGDPPDAPVSLEQTAVLELYDQPYLRMDIDGLRFTFQIPADAGDRVKELLK